MSNALATQVRQRPTKFLWLDLTRKCQLSCVACYNASGPEGGHGTMTHADWLTVLDQAAAYGVERVEFIGGEPTMYPEADKLMGRALDLGLTAVLYSNLVHVDESWWTLLCRRGAVLATSYYSDDPAEHNLMTGRDSHRKTLANIKKALELGIDLRVGIVVGSEDQRADEARRELEELGVTHINVDHVRPFGRAANGQTPKTAGLCGKCGTGRAAIGPDGMVSPCVFSTWMSVGSVLDDELGGILNGTAMSEANKAIRRTSGRIRAGDPDDELPPEIPSGGYGSRDDDAFVSLVSLGGGDDDDDDDTETECTPGYPGSSCNPRN